MSKCDYGAILRLCNVFLCVLVKNKRCWIGPVNPATVFILCPLSLSLEAALDFASLFFIFTSARISKLIQSRLTFLSVTMLSCVSDVVKSFYIFISYHLLHLAYISLTVPFVSVQQNNARPTNDKN